MESLDWNEFVFVDTETTGLDEDKNELLEVTYAVGLGKPVTLYPEFYPNIFEGASPKALEVNKFFERFAGDDEGKWFTVDRDLKETSGVTYNEWLRRYEVWLNLPLEATDGEWESFVRAVEGKTLVGANVEFDVKFLTKYLEPDFKMNHSHRLFSIGSYASGKFGWRKPAGFWDTVTFLNKEFNEPEIPYGDHTAERDVLSTRQVFAHLQGDTSALRALAKEENKKH